MGMITDGQHDSDFGQFDRPQSQHQYRPNNRPSQTTIKEDKPHQPFFMPLRQVASDIEIMARTRIGVEMLDPNNTDATKTKAQLTMIKWYIASSLSAILFGHICIFTLIAFITMFSLSSENLESYLITNGILFIPFALAFLLPITILFSTQEFIIDKATKGFYETYISPFKATLFLCVMMSVIAIPILAFFSPFIKLLADELILIVPEFNLKRVTLTNSFLNYFCTLFIFYGLSLLYYLTIKKKATKQRHIFRQQAKRKQRDFVFDKDMIDAI